MAPRADDVGKADLGVDCILAAGGFAERCQESNLLRREQAADRIVWAMVGKSDICALIVGIYEEPIDDQYEYGQSEGEIKWE